MRNCLSVRKRSWEGVQEGRGGWGVVWGARRGGRRHDDRQHILRVSADGRRLA